MPQYPYRPRLIAALRRTLEHLERESGSSHHPNARRRHLHPAAQAVGVKIGGWHDFRHTPIKKMRKAGVHPVVVRGTVGHKRVELALEVYDRATRARFAMLLVW